MRRFLLSIAKSIAFGLLLISSSSFGSLVEESTLPDKYEFTVCFLKDSSLLNNPKVAFKRATRTVVIRRGNFFRDDITEEVPLTNEEEGISHFPDSLRTLVQSAVLSSFSSTGISFQNWKDCDNSSPSDLILVYANNKTRSLETGTTGDPSKVLSIQGKATGKQFNTIRINSGALENTAFELLSGLKKLEELFKLNLPRTEIVSKWNNLIFQKSIVHEFGHVIGLQHEHMRKEGYSELSKFDLDRFNRGYQKIVDSNGLLDFGYSLINIDFSKRLMSFGDYDILSAMNYTWFFNSNRVVMLQVYCDYIGKNPVCDSQDRIDLLLPLESSETGFFSKQDIAGIRHFYFRENFTEALSNENYKTAEFSNWLSAAKKTLNMDLNL